MKKMSLKSLLAISATTAFFLTVGAAAKAAPLPLSIVFSPSGVEDGVGGQTLTFDAGVTNNGLTLVYLNSDSYSLVGGLGLSDTDYLNNAPFFLAAGESSSDFAIFTVTIPNGTPDGVYAGNFEILGGGPMDFTDEVGSANFDVEVTPEPPTWELMALALMAVLGMKSWSTYRRQTAA
jgi:hypothetical protein